MLSEAGKRIHGKGEERKATKRSWNPPAMKQDMEEKFK